MAMSETRREALHKAVEGLARPYEEAVLLGFVVVAEWAGLDGARTLTLHDGAATGEPLPPWQREGYLHNALTDADAFHDEPIEDDGEEEEDLDDELHD